MSRTPVPDNALLTHMRANGWATAGEIAKQLSSRTHSVQRKLRLLKARGVLRPFLVLNPHVLGLNDFCLFFSVLSGPKDVRQKVVKYCNAHARVSFFAELAGEDQFTVSILAKTVLEVEEFLHGLQVLVPGALIRSKFALRINWRIYGSKSGKKVSRSALARGAGHAEVTIDELDARFIAHYSAHPEKSVLQVARDLGLPEATLRVRLKRLREKNVLVGLAYAIDWSALGYLPARLLIDAHSSKRELAERLESFASKHELVSEYVRCIGAWDFELNFAVQNATDVGSFAQEVREQFFNEVHLVRPVAEVSVHKLPQYAALAL